MSDSDPWKEPEDISQGWKIEEEIFRQAHPRAVLARSNNPAGLHYLLALPSLNTHARSGKLENLTVFLSFCKDIIQKVSRIGYVCLHNSVLWSSCLLRVLGTWTILIQPIWSEFGVVKIFYWPNIWDLFNVSLFVKSWPIEECDKNENKGKRLTGAEGKFLVLKRTPF